ncbi:hypothetical protein [Streptomyces hirsutus]|uniref:hypothetical protein n=1 Tax=Streptomyces hirsutus TaxID=35620 RepID=UPI003675FFF2
MRRTVVRCQDGLLVEVLGPDYRRIMEAFQATEDDILTARQVTVALGREAAVPSHAEDARGRLKRLVGRGRDKAGNLASRDGSKNTCPDGTAYMYDDATELTGKNGSTTGWSYDKPGNETAGGRVAATARTNEM